MKPGKFDLPYTLNPKPSPSFGLYIPKHEIFSTPRTSCPLNSPVAHLGVVITGEFHKMGPQRSIRIDYHRILGILTGDSMGIT